MIRLYQQYPKESAIVHVIDCLDDNNDCGLVTETPCWDIISQSETAYAVAVLWYNQEDEICCRGGDEIMLEIKYTDGSVLNILSYEGFFEQCEIVDTNVAKAHQLTGFKAH